MRFVRPMPRNGAWIPNAIGVMGFSAGGHMASTIATHGDNGDPTAADPIEPFSLL